MLPVDLEWILFCDKYLWIALTVVEYIESRERTHEPGLPPHEIVSQGAFILGKAMPDSIPAYVKPRRRPSIFPFAADNIVEQRIAPFLADLGVGFAIPSHVEIEIWHPIFLPTINTKV